MIKFLKQFFDIKFWKFIFVGILNTLVGNGLKFLFILLLPFTGATNVLVAGVTSTALASVMSYFLNKHFTFKNTEKGIKPIIRFALNIALCYGIAYITMVPLTIYICNTFELAMFGMTVEKTGELLSGLFESCMFVACNYIGQRFFAFKTDDKQTQ